ncbi:MAG TPA: sensor histidine kinase [Gemmatimonadales bacterium]|nr:sensor histidine kinase [Gemmatimonadales bacterium]
MTSELLRVALRVHRDVVVARQRARDIARHLGLDSQEQIRVATAVSEVARNAVEYGGGGSVEFAVGLAPEPELIVRVIDQGPGIPHLDQVLGGLYQSTSGLGIGLMGARRLMDRFHATAPPGGGTTIDMGKTLPRMSPAERRRRLAAAAEALASDRPGDPYSELQAQNQELVRTLAALRERELDQERLNVELSETNRGVLALYAELDDRAAELARASQLKSAFLSGISHELRTPLNSILNITRILMERMDGELTPEQDRQVSMIRRAASSLIELVNDLLDLARIEAGKTEVRVTRFTAGELFGTLRGMFRPMLTSDDVTLVFEQAAGELELATDEGKVAQILRNFISNAIKFTERGEIRVTAAPGVGGETVVLAVSDTGIGIAPDDQHRIFQEFEQVDHALQQRVTGTGLGLPLSRKLAGLLGGRIELQSEPGVGSRFELTIPRTYQPPVEAGAIVGSGRVHG